MRILSLALATALLIALVAAAGIAAGPVEAGPYHDEGRQRSGFSAYARAFGCEFEAYAEYFDDDGDYLPDTIPPGGPPPRVEHNGVVC